MLREELVRIVSCWGRERRTVVSQEGYDKVVRQSYKVQRVAEEIGDPVVILRY